MGTAPHRTSKDLTVRMVETPAGWAALGAGWNELLAESDANEVFMTWEWLDCWMQVYGDGGQWIILVAENIQGQLVGIAPMMIHQCRGVRYLQLVGQKADTTSEYLGWLLRRTWENDAGPAFADFLQRQACRYWDVLDFHYVPAGSATARAVAQLFPDTFKSSRQTLCPVLPLPGSWEAFLASRRAKFRQRWTRFQREHTVLVRVAGRDFTVTQGLEILQNLNEKRWGERRQSFKSARYVRFHQMAAERLAAAGHLLLIFLEVDGQIIAGRYDFVYNGRALSFQGGWLPEWEKQSAGKLILTAIMQWCCENGVREYDFLGGAAAYKDDWAEDSRELLSLSAENPRSSRVALHHLQNWLRRVLRGRG